MALRRFNGGFRANREASEPKARILYVEDDDALWRVTSRYLRDKYDLSRATTSEEALNAVVGRQFDLILLDIELAGSMHDGLQICRFLRGVDAMPFGLTRPAWLEDVPIIFVTAYTSRYPRGDLIKVGGNEVVTKPVDYTRLLLVSSRLIVAKLRGGD